MGTYFFKIKFPMLLYFLHTQVSILGFNSDSPSHVKCIEKERQALLNFKQSVLDDLGILSTWRDDENSKDCCAWKGIYCNNETGHVHMLDIRGQDLQYLGGPINITSLIDLQNIEHMDLSNNNFFCNQNFIGSFTNLRYLNLSYSGIYGRIPHDLGDLSELEYLDLSTNDDIGIGQNYLYGQIPYQLGNLSKLKYLDLSGNSLSGTIPFQVGNLPFLHTLRLGGNFDLKISNAKWLSSLSSLTTFGLNSLHNLKSSHSWNEVMRDTIPNLTELRLVNCSLSDDDISFLLPSHHNLSTSLSILDLSNNMLTSSTFQLLFNYSLNLQELYLSNNNIVLSSPDHYLNFPSLVILDLSQNNLTLLILQELFNVSSKLRELYLHSCGLTDKSFVVPYASDKSSSSSLVTLVLYYNSLKSSAIYHWLSNLTTNLQTLDLYESILQGSIPYGFGKELNFLEVLDLSSNNLQGKIPTSLGDICTLQKLNLGFNNLSGEISDFIQNSSQCNKHLLQDLDLSHNWITGKIPNLSIFTSLLMLDLSFNKLSGEIPKDIGLLYELMYLHLEGNHLEGEISEFHLKNLSKLVELDLTDNSLSLKFGTTWVPPFQLTTLGLASCTLGPNFPSWIQSQSHLEFIDISDAGIDDFVPEWFWNKLHTITRMNMSYNSLKGTIPNIPIDLAIGSLKLLILSSNKFEGGIPAFLSQGAYILDLSENKFSEMNTFLCEKTTSTSYIYVLNLSSNQIMGHLPNCWEHLNSLEFLDLSNNKLSGKIPRSMDGLVSLKALVLRNNNFTGELPVTLKNCTSLVILDVGENFLSGPIPSWIGESLQQLKILSLRVNHFFGSVPVHLCFLRQILLFDLSRNNLSGRIPTCMSNFTAMKEILVNQFPISRDRKMKSDEYDPNSMYESNVLLMWKGQEDVYWNPEIFLKSIDLSSNDLIGEIPIEVGNLLGLLSLNLSRNSLSGEIPANIGNLTWLEFLDLSRNHFSGKIPSTLSKIDRLGMLDLSNNDLIGRIPWGRQLQTFDASSFEGNIGLCGQQLNRSCPGDKTTTQTLESAVDSEDNNSIFYEGLYMSLGLGFFIGFWGLTGPILLWRPWRIAYLRFLNRLTDYIFVVVELNVMKFKCYRWLKG